VGFGVCDGFDANYSLSRLYIDNFVVFYFISTAEKRSICLAVKLQADEVVVEWVSVWNLV
jgi:hypothetical protein